jgi:type II secretory pathway component PulJ
MRRNRLHGTGGFTIGEMMVVVAMTSIIMGAALSASVALQKSMWASDKFFSTHMQQIRIIDYLSRDTKRAMSVTTSADRATVTCTVPNYVVAAGDSEIPAAAGAEGERRTPIITVKATGPQIDYGRRVTDASITTNSKILTSASAQFTAADVGSLIWGVGIQPGSKITARNSATSVTMSENARATITGTVAASWARTSTVVYALNNETIERRENGAVTTIAASTDQLVPDTVDIEQANTEYTASTVTFLPVFNFNPRASAQGQAQQNKRKGTTVFAKAYLRNRRRG